MIFNLFSPYRQKLILREAEQRAQGHTSSPRQGQHMNSELPDSRPTCIITTLVVAPEGLWRRLSPPQDPKAPEISVSLCLALASSVWHRDECSGGGGAAHTPNSAKRCVLFSLQNISRDFKISRQDGKMG